MIFWDNKKVIIDIKKKISINWYKEFELEFFILKLFFLNHKFDFLTLKYYFLI